MFRPDADQEGVRPAQEARDDARIRTRESGDEGTQLEYKYALDSSDAWFNVEKDAGCGEISNRLLTLAYGTDGTQTVNDTVLNWRNVAPCGN